MHTTVQNLHRDWYVLYSKPHKEEQVQFYLGLKGVESFFPRLHLPGAGKSTKRIVPLFPNYLFARMHLPTEYQYVIWSPGVKRIVSFSDTPIPLEESVINFLQRQADGQGVIPARSQLKRGQEVEISGGPFDGLLGIIQDPPDTKGRVKILLKLLSRQVSVKLGVEFIRGDWTGFEPALAPNIGPGLVSAVG
jgi:transcription antitermination factor NusG